MYLSFADRLQARIDELQNPSLLGLDPRLEYIPETVMSQARASGYSGPELVANAFWLFNQAILNELKNIIPAVKFQSACYEQYGPAGIKTLQKSITLAKELGYISIIDSKRNDIGSSAEAYANSSIGESTLYEGKSYLTLDADAVTINAYLGSDGVEPFLEYCRSKGKGCFVLVRTSNPSAGDLQDLGLQDGRKLYEAMADLVSNWSDELDGNKTWSSLGAVVGATWPNQAKELRERMPRQIFLIPGYGAQGAGALDAVAGFKEGKGGIVNSSRGIMLAWKKYQGMTSDDFLKAARLEALDMKEKLQEALASD